MEDNVANRDRELDVDVTADIHLQGGTSITRTYNEVLMLPANAESAIITCPVAVVDIESSNVKKYLNELCEC
jgi:hypothetical protein